MAANWIPNVYRRNGVLYRPNGLRESDMDVLMRYTRLSSVVDIIRNSRVALRPIDLWDDMNDKALMERYRAQKGFKKIYACCFTHSYETHHHWKGYGSHKSSICVEFERRKLVDSIKKAEHVVGRIVDYIGIADLSGRKSDPSVWPFLKRLPYAHEDEYRIIAGSTATNPPSEIYFKIQLAAIRSIRVNPFLGASQSDKLITFLKKECKEHRVKGVSIYKSTVLSSRDWLAEVDTL